MATKITVQLGDITTLKVDAIVNAANSSLLDGGGVDGAIHRAGGPAILEECKQVRNRQGGCNTGEAVITNAGNLNAQKVIHTVGPVWQGGKHNEASLLAACYTNSLQLALQHNCRRVAFPNISTGVYGYPKKQAASIAIQTVSNFLQDNRDELDEIIFICFDEENYNLYQQELSGKSF